MRKNPYRQHLWILPVVLVSLTLMGCALRQPSKVQMEPMATGARSRYTIDHIEKDIAIVLPRDQRGEPMVVPYNLLTFAQEGDIIYSTGDPSRPFVLDEDSTTRVKRDIDRLLTKLQERPEPVK